MSEIEKTTQNLKENFKRAMNAKVLTKVIYGVCIVIVISIVFQAGMYVGFHKAQFNGAWGEHYEKNFGMRSRGPMGRMMGNMPDQFTNGHGTVGKIAKLELPNIIVIDKDSTEKIIITNNDTDIISINGKISTTDLKISDQIVIIGTPNDQGQIVAKFVRVLPSPIAPAQVINPKQ